MQSLLRTNVKAIICKLLVFIKMSTSQNFVAVIAFVIEEYIPDMFYADTNLMSMSGFEYILHQRDISQSSKHPTMNDYVFAHQRVGYNRHLHPASRVTGDTVYDRAFILLHVSPNKGTISALGHLTKELYSEVGPGI